MGYFKSNDSLTFNRVNIIMLNVISWYQINGTTSFLSIFCLPLLLLINEVLYFAILKLIGLYTLCLPHPNLIDTRLKLQKPPKNTAISLLRSKIRYIANLTIKWQCTYSGHQTFENNVSICFGFLFGHRLKVQSKAMICFRNILQLMYYEMNFSSLFSVECGIVAFHNSFSFDLFNHFDAHNADSISVNIESVIFIVLTYN